jgi:hypothetical protein
LNKVYDDITNNQTEDNKGTKEATKNSLKKNIEKLKDENE